MTKLLTRRPFKENKRYEVEKRVTNDGGQIKGGAIHSHTTLVTGAGGGNKLFSSLFFYDHSLTIRTSQGWLLIMALAMVNSAMIPRLLLPTTIKSDRKSVV